MNKKFYIILLAHFLSALADNALLFTAIALLAQINAPEWHTPLLQQFFVISYIVLAPFVGTIADSFSKSNVMIFTNLIKVVGCLCMLLGVPPLISYGIAGVGAAGYSPAKYGILTELLPSSQLVTANGWMEGSTVVAIVAGTVLGGLATNYLDIAMWVIGAFYLAAAIFNCFIPKLPIDHRPEQKSIIYLIKDFYHAFMALWKDPLGQVSLAVTTLFWGAGATLRLVVLSWAMIVLSFSQQHATYLIVAVPIGVAIGAIVASFYISLEKSVKVLPAGIMMGILVLMMAFINDVVLAALVLFVIGILSGFFVVPLNALLQHRGHYLIGAGHSIAVQNFNEHIGILVMLGFYLMMVKANIHINVITAVFGLIVIVSMGIINHIYRNVKVSA